MENGEHVRVSLRTGRIIPIPIIQETVDYKFPQLYQEQPKDTTKADVENITYEVRKIFGNYPYFFICRVCYIEKLDIK